MFLRSHIQSRSDLLPSMHLDADLLGALLLRPLKCEAVGFDVQDEVIRFPERSK
jgi:predicted Zn-ribbon and HTH transcriptional regulator